MYKYLLKLVPCVSKVPSDKAHKLWWKNLQISLAWEIPQMGTFLNLTLSVPCKGIWFIRKLLLSPLWRWDHQSPGRLNRLGITWLETGKAAIQTINLSGVKAHQRMGWNSQGVVCLRCLSHWVNLPIGKSGGIVTPSGWTVKLSSCAPGLKESTCKQLKVGLK